MLDETRIAEIFLWSIALILMLMAGFWAALQIRRWWRQPDEPSPIGFTLSDLRQLHRSGKMSTEEFERAKVKVARIAARQFEKAPAKTVTAGRAQRTRGIPTPPNELGFTQKPEPGGTGDLGNDERDDDERDEEAGDGGHPYDRGPQRP